MSTEQDALRERVRVRYATAAGAGRPGRPTDWT